MSLCLIPECGYRITIMKIKKILVLLIFMFLSFSVHAVDPYLSWKTIESDHFYIHYALGYERLAQKAANSAEQAHSKLQPVLSWQPDDKTHLVISDETDQPNGFATPVYFNRSVVFLAPPDSVAGLEDFDDWMETIIIHEYTHILHLDKASGGAEMLRQLLGRHFLLFSNLYQPGWFTEGLATYYETDLDKGIGRGQSRVYEMMMRVEVANGVKPVSQVNLPILSWPTNTVNYLYGVHFYQFVEDTYGVKGIDSLIENYSNNIIPFMINSNAQQVFDKDINDLWDEFTVWLNKKYQADFHAQLVEGKKITDLGYSTGPIDAADKQTLYYIANSAFEHAALMKINNNIHQYISDVHRGARLNVHAESGILITQMEFCDEYNINSDIYIIEPAENGEITGEPVAITQCGRYRSASWSADGKSIIAVKTDKAVSQLVLLNKQGEQLKILWQGNNTDIVTQLKISPVENKIIAAVFRTDHGWNIEEFDLDTAIWKKITDDRYIDMYPAYSENGKSIVFSSERSGKYQIYRYIKGEAQLQQITRVESGAFNPLQQNPQAPLYYTGYNRNGYDVYRLDKTPALALEKIKTSNQLEVAIAADVETTEASNYAPLSSLYPRWWFPYVSLNEDRNEYGVSTSGGDALGVHNYVFNMAYDTNNKWLIGDIRYAFANNFSMGYQRSTAILRDTNGEFAVARNVDDLFFSLALNYPAIESNLSYRLGVLASESSDGFRAAGISPQPVLKDNLLGLAVLYSNAKNYIRSISRDYGRSIRLVAETTEAFDSDFSGEIYTLDWREYISMGDQHVLALKFVQGWGTDAPYPFSLGGEKNEYTPLDFLNPVSGPLFGDREYALRGYPEGLPELTGRRMQIATLEWRLPGRLIERGYMAPPIGIIQWSGSIFTETGAAYNDSSAEKYYSSAGVELQADINLFYGFTTRMRLGYGKGFDKEIGEDRIYFNLGSSF